MEYVYNNSRSIVRGWKELFQRTKNPNIARKIEIVTGETPDWSDKDCEEKPIKYIKSHNELTEDELIQESIKNNTQIY